MIGTQPKCKHCDRNSEDCYEHCPETESGSHEANPTSATQADKTNFTVDYTCRHCGQSGSVAINPEDIAWN